MSFFNANQIEKIISFASEAGEIALAMRKSANLQVRKKSDNTVLTNADIAISEFLKQKLSQEFPEIPIICEEGNLRKITDEIFWLIDPIDGTSSFAKGSTEFATNIALIKNKKPIFGLINAPAFAGGKMIFTNAQNKIESLHEGVRKTIDTNAENQLQSTLRIITSNKSKESEILQFISQFFPNFSKNFSVIRRSSAVKFFAIVENEADLFAAFHESSEWDTAAGQALIEACGGKLKNLTLQSNSLQKFILGEELLYKKNDFANQLFVCYIKKLNNDS